jgi:hypothetical protein
MVAWGLKVNDYGNAILDDDGNFIKMPNEGVTDELWAEMTAYAADQGWKGGNYKKLNLVFENRILGQARGVRDRMARRVETFVHEMMTNVFNAENSAEPVMAAILETGGYDPGPTASRIEDPADWTPEKITERAAGITGDKGPAGDFDD